MNWTIWTPAPVPGEWPWPIAPASVVCRFNVDCDPVPWARAGRAGARTFTPRRVREHEDLVGWRMRVGMNAADVVHIAGPLDDPLGLVVFFFVKTRARRDRDNFLKAVQDAGNGVVWADDSQIVEGFERVFYDPERPRTEGLVYRVMA